MVEECSDTTIKSATDDLSDEALEVVRMIRDMATEMMFNVYEYLPISGWMNSSVSSKPTFRSNFVYGGV